MPGTRELGQCDYGSDRPCEIACTKVMARFTLSPYEQETKIGQGSTTCFIV